MGHWLYLAISYSTYEQNVFCQLPYLILVKIELKNTFVMPFCVTVGSSHDCHKWCSANLSLFHVTWSLYYFWLPELKACRNETDDLVWLNWRQDSLPRNEHVHYMKPWFKRFRAFQILIGLKMFGIKFQEGFFHLLSVVSVEKIKWKIWNKKPRNIWNTSCSPNFESEITGLSSYIDVGNVNVGNQFCWLEDQQSSTSINYHHL